MAYVPNLDPGLIATVKEEIAKKEFQQRKHYFLFNELKNMAKVRDKMERLSSSSVLSFFGPSRRRNLTIFRFPLALRFVHCDFFFIKLKGAA